ncbi:MAG: hypothetical protein GX299_08810 [Epulopiscium sp.]|jgi:hypothetical protein|nr:hypothetical protein [Candidatus Epulonipiscium sp.]
MGTDLFYEPKMGMCMTFENFLIIEAVFSISGVLFGHGSIYGKVNAKEIAIKRGWIKLAVA